MNEIIYWVWLSLKSGCGSAEAIKLLQYFPGGAKEIWEASSEQLAAVSECSKPYLHRLEDRDLTAAERVLEECFAQGIRVISVAHPEYPARLHSLYNKPVVLYLRGNIADLNERFCVSIVGTRDMSEYGKHMTFTLARQLIGYGAIIISGAAYGIDASANNTALFFESPTVAVLGSGVNVPYPSEHAEMLDRIAANGMVISEFPPNTPPVGKNFPIRNRIISGLCDALIVVEAGVKSGALITAQHAADQRRKVYAVPGNVGSPNSMGTNILIRDGAKLVMRSEDVLEDFADRFDLRQIDRIIESDKYRRYEYNSRMPIAPENVPITAEPTQTSKTYRENPSPRRQGMPIVTASHANPPKAQAVLKPVRTAPEKAQTARKESSPPTVNSSARERVLAKLDPLAADIFRAIPEGKAASTDQIVQCGFSAEDVMASLTMLELYSAVEALPGGLYKKII